MWGGGGGGGGGGGAGAGVESIESTKSVLYFFINFCGLFWVSPKIKNEQNKRYL